jgi:hypothetical protein
MDWILANMVSGYHAIERIANWATTNPGPAFFFGAFLWALLNTIVKLTPTSADDIVVDIIAKALKTAYDKAFRRDRDSFGGF